MSELKVNIRIDQILPVEEGKSSNGSWQKISFLGEETESNYPKTIGFEIFGQEKVEKFQQYNKVGDIVEVSFNLESREYNGKIYTTASAWKVWNNNATASAAPPPPSAQSEEEDLPF